MSPRFIRLHLHHSVYLAGVAGLGAAAVLLGGWLPRAACFLWIGAGLADLAWAAVALRTVDVRLEPREALVDAGQPLTAELTVRRLTRLPAFPILLRDAPESPLRFTRVPGGEVLTEIRGGPARPLLRRLPARRGRFRLGPLRVIATGPFGVGRAWCDVGSRREVLVLPRVWPLPSWPLQAEGRGRVAAGAGGAEPGAIAGVRPLLPGDAPRRIHWNRSAATGAWQVKEFDRPAAPGLRILLDLERVAYDGPGGAELCDAAVDVAASLAGAALSRGQPVTLHATCAPPLDLMLRPGPTSLRRLLAALAEVRADGARPLAEHLGFGGTRLFVVTPADAAGWGPVLAGRLRDGLRPSAVLLLRPDADAAGAARTCAELRRMGIPAWPAAGAADLARQLAGRGA